MISRLVRSLRPTLPLYTKPQQAVRIAKVGLVTLLSVGSVVSGVAYFQPTAQCAEIKKDHVKEEEEEGEVEMYKRSHLQEYFVAKSSLRYEGEYYMTGQDFLEAMISEVIDEKRKIDLYPSEYRYMIAKAQEDTHFKELFTSDAIISYPDYIFLRSVLIRPDDLCMKSFQMLDLNNDGTISHDEYKELYKMFSKNRESDPKRSLTTTLQIKLFGIDEKSKVTVSDFEQLIQEVQHHCLRAEFNQFTHGTDHIPKAAFMKSILRRTKVTDIQYSRFVDKVEGYRPEQQVSFTQFVSVINLLNNFSDFEVAVRMYQIAKKPISRSIFQRAALVCSGQKLDDDIVDLIYYVFDEAGDGKLSHSEFVNIMREKRTQSIHSTKNEGPLTTGQYYKKCIRTQMWRAYA